MLGLFRRAIEFRMQIVAALAGILLLFHGSAVSIGPCILANTGHLPGDFDVRFVRLDGEGVVSDLRSDPCLCWLTNCRELIAEVTIESLKPLRQFDHCLTTGVGGHVAIIDVLHLGRFDGGVEQIFVGWIQRMVDVHRRRGLVTAVLYENAPLEIAGVVKGDTTQETFVGAAEGHNAFAG